MAKDLTWFKFNPSNWMMGRIQRQSDAVQVSFVRLMCNYWHNQCQLPIEEAELECGEEAFSVLLKQKLIVINGDHISIKFLDEQRSDIELTKKQNSDAGKASAEARRANKYVEKNEININDRSTTVQRNLTDKSIDIDKKEIKIKKDNSIADAEASEVFNSCKKSFLEFYLNSTGTEYYFTAKDGAKLKALIKKITFKVKEKNSGQKEKADIIWGFEIYIKEAYLKSEHWVQQNFSLTTLDSKFNEIFNQIINSKTQSKLAQTQQAFSNINFQ